MACPAFLSVVFSVSRLGLSRFVGVVLVLLATIDPGVSEFCEDAECFCPSPDKIYCAGSGYLPFEIVESAVIPPYIEIFDSRGREVPLDFLPRLRDTYVKLRLVRAEGVTCAAIVPYALFMPYTVTHSCQRELEIFLKSRNLTAEIRSDNIMETAVKPAAPSVGVNHEAGEIHLSMSTAGVDKKLRLPESSTLRYMQKTQNNVRASGDKSAGTMEHLTTATPSKRQAKKIELGNLKWQVTPEKTSDVTTPLHFPDEQTSTVHPLTQENSIPPSSESLPWENQTSATGFAIPDVSTQTRIDISTTAAPFSPEKSDFMLTASGLVQTQTTSSSVSHDLESSPTPDPDNPEGVITDGHSGASHSNKINGLHQRAETLADMSKTQTQDVSRRHQAEIKKNSRTNMKEKWLGFIKNNTPTGHGEVTFDQTKDTSISDFTRSPRGQQNIGPLKFITTSRSSATTQDNLDHRGNISITNTSDVDISKCRQIQNSLAFKIIAFFGGDVDFVCIFFRSIAMNILSFIIGCCLHYQRTGNFCPRPDCTCIQCCTRYDTDPEGGAVRVNPNDPEDPLPTPNDPEDPLPQPNDPEDPLPQPRAAAAGNGDNRVRGPTRAPPARGNATRDARPAPTAPKMEPVTPKAEPPAAPVPPKAEAAAAPNNPPPVRPATNPVTPKAEPVSPTVPKTGPPTANARIADRKAKPTGRKAGDNTTKVKTVTPSAKPSNPDARTRKRGATAYPESDEDDDVLNKSASSQTPMLPDVRKSARKKKPTICPQCNEYLGFIGRAFHVCPKPNKRKPWR